MEKKDVEQFVNESGDWEKHGSISVLVKPSASWKPPIAVVPDDAGSVDLKDVEKLIIYAKSKGWI